jgi:hypothetical protein
VIVVLLDTIERILDHATKSGGRRAPSPRASKTGPALSKSMIDALEKAKKDKANLLDHWNLVSSMRCRRGAAASASSRKRRDAMNSSGCRE